MKTKRDPGKIEQIQVREKVQERSSLYISVYPAHGPSSVLSGETKTDINGRVVCAIEKGKAV